MAVRVGQRFLQDTIERDAHREVGSGEVVVGLQRDARVGEVLVLQQQFIQQLTERSVLELGRARGADKRSDLGESVFQQGADAILAQQHLGVGAR